MLRRSLILVVALAAAAIALVAAQSSSARSAAFPITIHAANGDVVIKARPTRIVSLSPTATEDLFAVGAGAQVIAVDDQSNYPKRAPRTKLSGFTPNVEAIASYKPDLVVVSNDPAASSPRSRSCGITVLLEPAATNVAQAYAQIRAARTRDRPRAGATKLVRLDAAVADARSIRSVPKKSRHLKVYHELEPDYYSATSTTFIGRVYRLLGLRNIADAADKTQLRLPAALGRVHRRAEPRPVVLADTICCGQSLGDGEGAARAGAGSPPCANGGVVAIDDDVASRWGPRIVDFVRAVAAQSRSARRDDRGRRRYAPGTGRHARPRRAASRVPGRSCAARVPRRARSSSACASAPSASAGSAIVASALSHLPFLHVHSPLSERARGDPLAAAGAARRARRARRRHARARGRGVPGRLPEPARRPVPARRRRRRRASARRSRSRTASRRRHADDLLPVAAFVGGARRRSALAYVLGRSAGGGARDRRARPRRRDGRGVPHRAPDVRAAAAHGHAAGGLRWLLGGSRHLGLARRGLVRRRTSSSSSIVLILPPPRARRAERRRRGGGEPRRRTSAATRLLVVVCATIGTAAAVAVSGLIGFVGIIVPHTIRLLVSARATG